MVPVGVDQRKITSVRIANIARGPKLWRQVSSIWTVWQNTKRITCPSANAHGLRQNQAAKPSLFGPTTENHWAQWTTMSPMSACTHQRTSEKVQQAYIFDADLISYTPLLCSLFLHSGRQCNTLLKEFTFEASSIGLEYFLWTRSRTEMKTFEWRYWMHGSWSRSSKSKECDWGLAVVRYRGR